MLRARQHINLSIGRPRNFWEGWSRLTGLQQQQQQQAAVTVTVTVVVVVAVSRAMEIRVPFLLPYDELELEVQ